MHKTLAALITAFTFTAAQAWAADADINLRLNYLGDTLQEQQTKANYWEYGWGAFDAGTMVWSAVQAGNESDRKNRNADIVQASESLIGLADVIFRPLPAFHADSLCEGSLVTQQEKQQCLGERETMLRESAERAHEPYEVLPHLGNFGFNLVAGLIVWRVAGTPQALATAIPGEIIGELQIWTTPYLPIDDLEQYKIRFGPMLTESEHGHSPAAGIKAALTF